MSDSRCLFPQEHSMKRRVTITLNEKVSRWARLESVRQRTRLTRFLRQILEERMARKDPYQKTMKRALRRKPFLRSDNEYLSREDAHSLDVK
jgi:hypothetical protein